MIDRATDILGYRFSNDRLLAEALTHASSAERRGSSNERMEFLGDAILGLIVCEYLFNNFPDLQEGEMTKIKSAVVSRRVCARISQEIKLETMLNLGKGMSGRPQIPSSVAAAVLESIIAAIYLDGGMEPTRDFVLRCMKPIIHEAFESVHQHNFKSVLQQYAQKAMPSNPEYVLMDEKGPDHAKAFEVCAQIDGRKFKSAWAKSKKEAEQMAALHALIELDLAQFDEMGRVVLQPLILNHLRPATAVVVPITP
jgi:ribonuclease-3